VGAAAALAGAFVAPPSLADEPGPDALPVTVVAVQTEDAYDQAEALTKALRSAVRGSRGWSLGEGDYALEVLTISLKCSDPPDASCESRIADQIKADRFLWGVLKKQGPDVVGEVHLWDRGKGSKKVDLRYSGNLTEPADDSLRKVAVDAVERLTGGPPKGAIAVRAGRISGQLFIDGAPVGALPNGQGTFAVPSGLHEITLKVPGYADSRAPVLVRPTATSEVVLTPIPVEPESSVDTRKIGGYVALGAGAALIGVGVYSSLQVSSVQNDDAFDAYRADLPASENACKKAESEGNDAILGLCDQASTFEVMQAVFYGLGAVAGGFGVYLLATSGSSEPEPTRAGLVVRPAAGPGGGKIDLTYRF
jgi:hypothetical protein